MPFETDAHISWVRKRLFIPALNLQLGGQAGTTVQVNSSGIYAFKCVAAATAFLGGFKVPADVNPHWPLGLTWHLAPGTSAFNSPATITMTSLLDFKAQGTVLAVATSALDTVHTAVTCPATAASATMKSTRGVKNANFLSRSQIFAGVFGVISGAIASSVTLSGTDFVSVLGLELDYVPMLTRFPHSEQDCPLDDTVG